MPARIASVEIEKWDTLPAHFMLQTGKIHLWLTGLYLSAEQYSSFWKTLSPDEIQRAGRFRFDVDRQRYVARHGLLRRLLGNYLSTPPEQVDITGGVGEKPELRGGQIQFNISSSNGRALFAFSIDRAVGVDIEIVREIPELDLVASRHFSATEIIAFNTLPAKKKISAFYHLWVQKEAFIKVLGKGLSYPLDCFDVIVDPDQPGKLVNLEGDALKAGDWLMKTFTPLAGFHAALCTEIKGLDSDQILLFANVDKTIIS